MMFVATPIIMDSYLLGINYFRGWENFVTAKSATKVTKISTPRKLPAINTVCDSSQPDPFQIIYIVKWEGCSDSGVALYIPPTHKCMITIVICADGCLNITRDFVLHGRLPGIKLPYICIEAAIVAPWNMVHGRLSGSGRFSSLPGTLQYYVIDVHVATTSCKKVHARP